jgi:hypothetical protein
MYTHWGKRAAVHAAPTLIAATHPRTTSLWPNTAHTHYHLRPLLSLRRRVIKSACALRVVQSVHCIVHGSVHPCIRACSGAHVCMRIRTVRVEGPQPPLTGGMRATSSPAAKGCTPRTYSPLCASPQRGSKRSRPGYVLPRTCSSPVVSVPVSSVSVASATPAEHTQAPQSKALVLARN